MTIFSRDSDLTTSPRDEDMLKKDVDMFIHKLLIIKFNHIPNYARLLVRRLWDRDQWLLVLFLRHRSWAAEKWAVSGNL